MFLELTFSEPVRLYALIWNGFDRMFVLLKQRDLEHFDLCDDSKRICFTKKKFNCDISVQYIIHKSGAFLACCFRASCIVCVYARDPCRRCFHYPPDKIYYEYKKYIFYL